MAETSCPPRQKVVQFLPPSGVVSPVENAYAFTQLRPGPQEFSDRLLPILFPSLLHSFLEVHTASASSKQPNQAPLC